jgi:PAS domain S-box-containing protein
MDRSRKSPPGAPGKTGVESPPASRSLGVSDKALRTLVEQYLDGVLLVVEGRIHYANRVLRDMTGYTAEEALGMPAANFLAPEDRQRMLGRIREIQAGGPEYPSQYQLLTKNGGTVPVEVSSRLVEYEGKPSLLSMIRNISRRKEAEAKVQVQLAAMDAASEGIGILDDRERYIYMNPAHAAIYGYDSPADLVGKTWRVLYDDREIARIEQEIFPLLERDGSWHGETPGRKRDGTLADVEISLTPLPNGGLICVCRDITERRRAESALRDSEERYRALYEDNPSMYFTVDQNGVVLSVNRYGADQLGYRVDELVDRPVLDVFFEEDRESVREHLAECLRNPDRNFDWEFRKVHRDGNIVWVRECARVVRDASGEPLVLIVCEDITQRKRAEEERRHLEAQVQHAQKLESLGLMAGGIAHDFNNLLVGVLGNAGLALSKLPDGSPTRKDILAVEKAADRAAELCKQLLAYSGRGRFELRAIDLSELVRDMEDLLDVAVAKKTTVSYKLAPELPAIEGDAAQMRQIVMNLMTNASEAIGDRTGMIELSTKTQRIGEDYDSPVGGPLAPGVYVCLEVADSGRGMDDETTSRIFDPFFTTKFTGRGLGLAAVLGIVRGHDGAIEVSSEPERGTVFRALFPATDQTVEAEKMTTKPREVGQGSGLILVIDDEHVVRTVARQVLEQVGFSVLTAADGREGVESFRKNGDEISLVLLDVTMPGLSGEESFRMLRDLRADVPVLLSSGFDEQEVAARFGGLGPGGFIQKPYRPEELVAAVRAVMDR